MGKILYTYAGFTAQDLKNRASIPSQADIVVGANYIDCSSVDIPSEIRDIIGEGSNDLGTIYCSAKVNKWSGFGPREWVIGIYPNIVNQPISNPYDMSNFCGYNHNAVAPIPFNATFEYPENAGGGIIDTTSAVKIKMGEYDWQKLGATHCKVITYSDGDMIHAQTGLMPILGAGQFVTFDNAAFSWNTVGAGTSSYKTKTWICSSDGSEIAALPIEGNVTCKIIASSYDEIVVRVNGNIKAFTMLGHGLEANSPQLTRTGKYTGMVTDTLGKTLQSIVYRSVDPDTLATLNTVTVTSFNQYEYPLELSSYIVNMDDMEAFGADTSRLSGLLRISMNYI